jgi:hypothetical protein
MSAPERPQLRSRTAAYVVQGILGFVVSRAIYVVAKLGVADLLAGGPLSAEELASRCDAHASSLERFLRTLVRAGIFVESAPGRFGLNEQANLLRSDVPGSLRDLALYFGELSYRGWEQVLSAAQTGRPAFDRVFGAGFWDYLDEHPEAAATFNGAMRGGAAARARALDAYDWSEVRTVVDVGGGDGTLLVDLLARHPHLRGVVFDRPHAVRGAGARIEEAGLTGRCTARAGDFLAEIPEEGDVYLLVIVLHDWDDDRAGAILAACRRAIREGAVLLLVEIVLATGDAPLVAHLLDLHMLVELGGRERTELEWRALLEAAGFRLARILPGEPWSVLEAVPS